MVKKIAIRVDTNEKIATGHVLRCMTVADSLVRMGAETVLVSADEGVVPFARGHEIGVHVLGTDWSDMESETDALIGYLKAENVDAMLVDSYGVSAPYFDRLREAGIRVACMDDLCEEAYPVEAVINYNPAAVFMEYERLYVGSGISLFLGESFIPIRDQFTQVRESLGRGILVTTGGTDSLGAADAIIRSIPEDSDLSIGRRTGGRPGTFDGIHLLAGRYFEPTECILRAIETGPVTLHRDVSDVASVMARCRVAVSSAGSTLYELSAMGIPTITFTIADNQMPNARFFAGILGAEAGPEALGDADAVEMKSGVTSDADASAVRTDCYMPYAGDFRTDREGCLRRVCAFLREAASMSDEELCRRGSRLRSLVDGRGADRIAEILLEVSRR